MRIGVRCLRRECPVSHTWRNGLLDGWSLHLRLSCSACPPKKIAVTRYSLPPHEKMSAATRCQSLFGTSVIMKGSASWRSAYVAQVTQACTYCRISADMPGQNISFISDLMARGMTILCPLGLSTRPCCQRTVLMNLAIVFCLWASL